MLEFLDVSLRYAEGSRDAVSGVSLKVERGTVISLLGPNGSGKSTLLLAALGWMKPREGEIFLEGLPLAGYTHGERSRTTAYLSQIERVALTYECLEFVLLGRAPHLAPLGRPDARDKERASAALAALGMGDFAHRHVTALSGGELQLVRIARCLVQEAPLVLLDEPTAALDPANSLRVADALVSLAGSGRTVLFSTHDAALAAYASSRTVLLREGRMLAQGLASETLTPDLLGRAFALPFGLSSVPSPFAFRRGANLDARDSPGPLPDSTTAYE